MDTELTDQAAKPENRRRKIKRPVPGEFQAWPA